MPSEDWWKLNPMEAFDEIQPDHPYYNEWAQILFDASENGAYSIPFSDRLGSGPLVNTVQFVKDNVSYEIDEWVVGFGDPVSVIPEPATVGLLLALGAGAVVSCRRRHQRTFTELPSNR